MDIALDRRRVIAGASGLVASLAIPSWWNTAAAAPLSPERGLESYRRMLCGEAGQEIFWWFTGDLYYQLPGRSVMPVARTLTIGGYTAGKFTDRSFTYKFREAGVILDLDTGQRLERNPFTNAPVEVPLVDEEPHDISWVVQDDGSLLRTQHHKESKLHLRWTETSESLMLIETTPGPMAFSLAPADNGVDWKNLESTRTVYARRRNLARRGFVPAEMIFHVTLKMKPAWLDTGAPGDHYFIVRGLGEKTPATQVLHKDAVDLVRRYFPKFL